MTSAVDVPPRTRNLRWIIPVAVLAVAGLAVGLVVGGSTREVVGDQIAGPGPVVAWGLPIWRLIATAASVLTVGLLGYAAVLGPQGRDGVLSQVGRRDVVRAGWIAVIWAVSSFMTALWSLAWALGQSLPQTLTPSMISTFAWSVASVRAFLLVALIAAGIGIACLFTRGSPRRPVWWRCPSWGSRYRR